MIPDIRRVGQHAALYAHARCEHIMEQIEDRVGDDWGIAVGEIQGEQYYQFQGRVKLANVRVELVATVDVESATLKWEWADEAAVSGAAELGRRLAAEVMREWGEEQDLSGFTTPVVPYEVPEWDGDEAESGSGEDTEDEEGEEGDELYAQSIAAAAVSEDVGDSAFEIFGSHACYATIPNEDESEIRIYLMDSFNPPMRETDLSVMFVKFDAILLECDDPVWSIEGIAYQREDWTVEEIEPEKKQRAWKIADSEGRYFVVELSFNEDGTIAELGKKGLFTEEGA